MWLGGSVSHLMAEALWALMYINEIGCYHIPTLSVNVNVEPILSCLQILTIASIIFKNANAMVMKSMNGPLTVYF